MDDVSLNKAKEKIERSKRLKRREKLLQIIEAIMSGNMHGAKHPVDDIFYKGLPRTEYVSPKDRGTNNYGYMEMKEMLSGTPFYDVV